VSGAGAGGAVTEFLAMGGHGLYVWLSYGAALAVVLYNLLSVRRRERRYVRDYRDRERRHAASRDSAGAREGDIEP
jgi:heme exporter protein D